MTLHLTYLLFNANRNKILCKIYLFSVVASVDNSGCTDIPLVDVMSDQQ